MHLYFYVPSSAHESMQKSISLIKKTLHATQSWISTNTELEEIQVSAEVLAETKLSATPLLERMDGLIIEGTHSDAQTGFFIAQAIAQKKPALYLYQRGTRPEIFSHISEHELPKHITVAPYEIDRLEKIVLTFLGSIEGSTIRDIPRHKFTLRITDAMEAFLHFKTHNTKVSKADFLREQVERVMREDSEWQTHQRRRRSGE